MNPKTAPKRSIDDDAPTSGQLDLRALTEAYEAEKRAGTAEPVAADDGPPPMFAPSDVLMPLPSAATDSRRRTMPIVLIAIAGVVLVAATALGTAYFVSRGGSGQAAAPAANGDTDLTAVPENEPAAPVVVAAVADPAGTPAPAVAPEPEVAPAGTPAPVAKAEPTDERRERRRSDDSDSKSEAPSGDETRAEILAELREKNAEPEAETAAPAPAPAATPAPAKPEAACDEVACLVDPSAPCCAKRGGTATTAEAKPAVDSNLPERLAASEVNAGLRAVRGRIESCGDRNGFSGVAKLKLVIAPDGSLESASVSEGNAAFQSCVKDKVEAARFKKSQKGLTVTYPFVFK